MKKQIISLSACLLVGLAACKKEEPLNVNFPAIFVVNGGSNSLSVLNLQTEEPDSYWVEKSISLHDAAFPHHIYLSPDDKKLAVAITGTDLSGGHGSHGGSGADYKVMILDAVSGKTLKEISLEHLPHNAIFSPDGTELWVGQASEPKGKVLVFDANSYEEKTSIEVGAMPSEVTFSADGNTVFVANTDDGTVTVIQANSKNVLATVAVGEDPVGAWTGSNDRMYVDNETSQTITELQAADGAPVSTIPLGFKPGFVAFHAPSGELWVSDATNGKVVIFQSVNDVWTKAYEVATGADAHAIVFSEDGTKGFVTNQGANNVSVVAVATYKKTKDIPVGKAPNGMVHN